jgi:hypothetical protein
MVSTAWWRKHAAFAVTPFREDAPSVSLDGKWLSGVVSIEDRF